MLSEEGLILVVVLVACALVVLGVLELVWPTRSRHPVRPTDAARDPWRRARSRAAPPPEAVSSRTEATVEGPAMELASVPPLVASDAGPASPAVIPAENLERVASAADKAETPEATTPPVAAVEIDEGPPPAVGAAEIPARPGEPAAPAAVSVAPSSADSLAEIATSSAAERSVVERCFALLSAERLAEVVSVAEERLKTHQSRGISVPSPGAAQEAAALWGVVGLAKQKLDDFRDARFAFEEAIAVAPGTERATWERHLATLALTAGRRAIADGAAEPSSPARIDSLRAAIDWLERGLVVAPHDAELGDALAGTRDALWPAYEAVVKKLVRLRKVAEARRILDEIVTDPDCPSERRGAFRRLLGSAMGTEAGQATAEAARHMQGGREEEAVAALARAESTIAAIAVDALAARRRRELEHRLWRGYMTLGVGRVEAGEHEAAIDPLFHALSFSEAGSERQDETRAMLARALGEIVDRRTAEIDRLADAGDTDAASAESDELQSLLRRAADQGLPDSHLTDAFDKTRARFRRLGKAE